ncbi:MAG: hypothetical protein GY934_08990 [Gammaproteobacteria bacterium]|nr:hypothetical protein [Gammaproteobacteria bacterium]
MDACAQVVSNVLELHVGIRPQQVEQALTLVHGIADVVLVNVDDGIPIQQPDNHRTDDVVELVSVPSYPPVLSHVHHKTQVVARDHGGDALVVLLLPPAFDPGGLAGAW